MHSKWIGKRLLNETIYKGEIMKKLIILLNVFLLTSSLLLLSGCVEPIMSCAGIKLLIQDVQSFAPTTQLKLVNHSASNY